MRAHAFAKLEGLGNDFVILEAKDEAAVTPDQARAICDRRRGVGGDGVVLVLPPRAGGSAARMKVLNADGSVPEMCGNGLRCVALHVARARGLRAGELTFDTDAGPRRCTIDDADGQGMVTVDMGLVRVLGERALFAAGEAVMVTVVDAGNPHAVLFGDYGRADAERLGPPLATDRAFPNGTNVELARVAAGAIDLVVWERGVGITLACGTGACATVAAACEKGLAPRGSPITVRLLGGALTITIDASGHAIMVGPARHVFDGTLAF